MTDQVFNNINGLDVSVGGVSDNIVSDNVAKPEGFYGFSEGVPADHKSVGVAPEVVPEVVAVDAERLIQWALMPGREGGLRWRDVADLSFDRGCTARMSRRQPVNWALCIAGVSERRFPAPRTVVLSAIGDGDAELVLAAIRALPGDQAALLVHHGRQKTRPAWTEPVETRRPRLGKSGRPWIAYQDPKRHAQPYCILEIETRHEATEAAMARYAAWWRGVALVAARVSVSVGLGRGMGGGLVRWQVSDFAAPAEPWLREAAPATRVWRGDTWSLPGDRAHARYVRTLAERFVVADSAGLIAPAE